jgi:putative intracellular protease/amidase
MLTRYKIVAIATIVLILGVACSPGEPTATHAPPTATPTAIAPANTPAPPTPVATSSPSPTPTPLLSLEKSPQEFDARGTFQVGLGDLDGDGDLDAVFANPQRHNSEVWLNDGRGTFTDTGQQLTQYGHGVGVADFDGDGDLDAFINCHYFVSPSKLYLNAGDATFQASGQDLGDAQISAAELNLVDLNGDGNMDVHVMYYDPNGLPDKVYLNDGTGTFSDSGLALDEETIAWGDLDRDGDVDYFGKRWGAGYVVQFNDGGGQFTTGWQMDDSQSTLGGVALADLDGDGDLDALLANGFRTQGGYPSRLLWNDGSGQFTDSGQLLNETLAAELGVGDLDGDGDLDVFVSNMDLPNQVWLNDGQGHLFDSGLQLGASTDASTKPSLGDLDGDGDLDVFVGSLMGKPEVWFNTTATRDSVEPIDSDLYLGQVPPGSDVKVFAPGVVSVEEGKEYKIAISPDLQEVFFTRRTPGGRDDRLWYSRIENGKLTTPELAPFACDCLESDACFTPDGKRLYYNSQRPLPGEEALSSRQNVWFVDKTEEGWGEPQFLGPSINDYHPVYFSIANDGTLYFTRSSPREIWYAELVDGQYLDAQRLPDEINYLRDVAHPAIAPDESYIIVDSYHLEDNRLVGSLYISFKKPDGSWTKAVSMRDVLKASKSNAYASPRITPDGKYLFFEDYKKETDQADIYWVSTKVIRELATPVPPTAALEPNTGTVVFIFGDRFINELYVTVRLTLEEAGYRVHVASTTLNPLQPKISGESIQPDLLLENLRVEDYDAIVFTCDNDLAFGGGRPETDRIAQDAVVQNKVLGAICNAPLELGFAGVLEGKTATGEPSQTCRRLESEFGATCTRAPVERDGLIVTAKDRYASRAFAQMIVKVLQEQSAPPVSFEQSRQSFASVPTFQIGLGDLDKDGDLDAVFANAGSNHSQVWLNDGSGYFVDSGQQLTQQGHGVSLGDLDSDGDLDLLMTCHQFSRPSRVYLNDGNAVFHDSGQDFGDARLSGNAANLADVDGDGDLDAIILYYEQGHRIYLNDGDGWFTPSEITFPDNSVWGDLDSDGDVDVFVKQDGAGYKTMLNDGSGVFFEAWAYEDTPAMSLGDVALVDVDNDGDLDAIATNGDYRSTGHPAQVFLNDGAGQFTDSGQRLSAVRNASVNLGDLNGDGYLDIVFTDFERPNQIWINDGSGQYNDSGFRFGHDQFYRHAHLGDLDQDGDLDIFVATFGIDRGPNEIWFNTRASSSTRSGSEGLIAQGCSVLPCGE